MLVKGGGTGHRVLIGAGLALGLLVAGWVALYLAAGSGIARGTTVLGVPIGGQSRAQAAATLERELADEVRAPIPVQAADVSTRVRPVRSGLSLDIAGTVASARARSWNPLHLLDALTGGDEVTPVVDVDRPALDAAVDRLAGRVDRETVEGTITFGAAGRPRVERPVAGRAVDRAEAGDVLADAYLTAYLTGGEPVEMPTRVDEPRISAAEVDRVAESVAAPATSADVLLTVEGTQVTLPRMAVARALTFSPDGAGSLAPALDGAVLHAAAADDLAAVETPAKDATFRIRNGTPRVVPSTQGREVLPDTLSAAVLPVLTETGPARVATVPLEVSEPAVSTEAAAGLGVVERISSFTTYYPSDFAPRLTNIHRAADYMDHTLVLPGKVFSLNRTVGERTAERGFAAGYIINNGRIEVDYGGGVSQLATTTFNAAFFAGLEILEHNPHSFYISRYPEGRESTVAWGFKDLRFRNDSPHGVFITTSYTNSSVTVRMYGTDRYRIEAAKGPRYDIKPFEVEYDPRPEGTEPGDCVETEGVPGFRVVVTRLFYQSGTQVRSEEFRTRYAPENEVVCGTTGPG